MKKNHVTAWTGSTSPDAGPNGGNAKNSALTKYGSGAMGLTTPNNAKNLIATSAKCAKN